MKRIFLILLGIIAMHYIAFPQSDTLVITLKSGEISKIAVPDINVITFENVTGVTERNASAEKLDVKGNYPNPVTDYTMIEFEIDKPGYVEIVIYDVLGNQMKTLVCEECTPGKNYLKWDCLDDRGRPVPNGNYIYEVHYNTEIQTRKMLILR